MIELNTTSKKVDLQCRKSKVPCKKCTEKDECFMYQRLKPEPLVPVFMPEAILVCKTHLETLNLMYRQKQILQVEKENCVFCDQNET